MAGNRCTDLDISLIRSRALIIAYGSHICRVDFTVIEPSAKSSSALILYGSRNCCTKGQISYFFFNFDVLRKISCGNFWRNFLLKIYWRKFTFEVFFSVLWKEGQKFRLLQYTVCIMLGLELFRFPADWHRHFFVFFIVTHF